MAADLELYMTMRNLHRTKEAWKKEQEKRQSIQSILDSCSPAQTKKQSPLTSPKKERADDNVLKYVLGISEWIDVIE